MSLEFLAWPKTPRLFRDMVVTEKIDGTNAAVIIESVTQEYVLEHSGDLDRIFVEYYGGLTTPEYFEVGAQSRKRVIVPSSDNFGFARWVHDNAAALVEILGPGRHFGEYWGSGIQRGYGLQKGEKRFSLFNVNRYADKLYVPEQGSVEEHLRLPGLDIVPVLYQGVFDTSTVKYVKEELALSGSHAAPGFDNPEGVVVFHSAAGAVFKSLLEGDDLPKGLAA